LDLANLPREHASLRTGRRHGGEQPSLLMIKVEMPRHAAGSLRGGSELRHLACGTADG
jgi:hypothetical protein